MTFEFFLPESGTRKNIHLKLTDTRHNKMYTFRTHLRISTEEWDKEKQRSANIYLKKCKKLNTKLDKVKKELAEYIREKKQKRNFLRKERCPGK